VMIQGYEFAFNVCLAGGKVVGSVRFRCRSVWFKSMGGELVNTVMYHVLVARAANQITTK
jgi:hypothetical protein